MCGHSHAYGLNESIQCMHNNNQCQKLYAKTFEEIEYITSYFRSHLNTHFYDYCS